MKLASLSIARCSLSSRSRSPTPLAPSCRPRNPLHLSQVPLPPPAPRSSTRRFYLASANTALLHPTRSTVIACAFRLSFFFFVLDDPVYYFTFLHAAACLRHTKPPQCVLTPTSDTSRWAALSGRALLCRSAPNRSGAPTRATVAFALRWFRYR